LRKRGRNGDTLVDENLEVAVGELGNNRRVQLARRKEEVQIEESAPVLGFSLRRYLFELSDGGDERVEEESGSGGDGDGGDSAAGVVPKGYDGAVIRHEGVGGVVEVLADTGAVRSVHDHCKGGRKVSGGKGRS
jgi:hypothetical protein